MHNYNGYALSTKLNIEHGEILFPFTDTGDQLLIWIMAVNQICVASCYYPGEIPEILRNFILTNILSAQE